MNSLAQPMPFQFSHTEEAGAKLLVLGLSVAERNRRHLQKGDFVEVPPLSAAPFALVRLRADVQYPTSLLKKLPKIVAENPHASHVFVDRNGQALPLRWDAGQEAKCVTHLVEEEHFVVTDLILQRQSSDVAKHLGDALFDEIYQNTQGWIARGLNKKISFWLTRRLVWQNITPNQITLINLFMGLVGCFFFLSKSYHDHVVAALLLQFNSIVDGCDGEVARLKVITSKIGGWLDTIADDVLNNFMFLCLIVGLYWETRDVMLFRFGLLSLAASLGVTLLIYQNLIENNSHDAAQFRLAWAKAEANSAQKKNWFDKIKPMLRRDFFIFVVCVAAILGWRKILLVFLLPIWGAFFLYLTSFLQTRLQQRK